MSQKVSVPYRGATFLNGRENMKKKTYNIVSVPYRGATFLNLYAHRYIVIFSILFPSPIGELHFSIFLLLTFFCNSL